MKDHRILQRSKAQQDGRELIAEDVSYEKYRANPKLWPIGSTHLWSTEEVWGAGEEEGEGGVKIALYIEDGLEQIVLTPESDTEAGILSKLDDGTREMSIRHGSFYECRGGWMRHKESYVGIYDGKRKDDRSTMIVLRERVAAVEATVSSEECLA